MKHDIENLKRLIVLATELQREFPEDDALQFQIDQFNFIIKREQMENKQTESIVEIFPPVRIKKAASKTKKTK